MKKAWKGVKGKPLGIAEASMGWVSEDQCGWSSASVMGEGIMAVGGVKPYRVIARTFILKALGARVSSQGVT